MVCYTYRVNEHVAFEFGVVEEALLATLVRALELAQLLSVS